MRLLFLVLLPLIALLSRDPVRPGASSLDPARIAAGTDSFLVAVQQNGQLGIVGVLVLSTRKDASGVLTRNERLESLEGQSLQVDSFALDAATLAPIHQETDGGSALVLGTAFHDNSVDVVLAALPLAPGFEAELILEREGGGEQTATARVTGTESVALVDGQTCPSWRVEVTAEGEAGAYYIGKASHELMRYHSPSAGLLINRARGCKGTR